MPAPWLARIPYVTPIADDFLAGSEICPHLCKQCTMFTLIILRVVSWSPTGFQWWTVVLCLYSLSYSFMKLHVWLENVNMVVSPCLPLVEDLIVDFPSPQHPALLLRFHITLLALIRRTQLGEAGHMFGSHTWYLCYYPPVINHGNGKRTIEISDFPMKTSI